MRASPLVLGLLSLIACSRSIDIWGKLAATPDRTRFLYTDSKGVHLRDLRTGDTQTIALSGGACDAETIRKADLLHLSPDAQTALAYGSAGNMAFDLFGHAGRHVSSSCLISLATGETRPISSVWPGAKLLTSTRKGEPRLAAGLASGNLYTWSDGFSSYPIEALRPDGESAELSLSGEACAVVETQKTLWAACGERFGDDPTIAIVRYDLSVWPPAEQERRAFSRGPGTLDGLAFSPTGDSLAYWVEREQKLGDYDEPSPTLNGFALLDTATLAPLFSLEEWYEGSVTTVEFHPQNKHILVANWTNPPKDKAGLYGRIRHFGPTGELLGTRSLTGNPEHLYWRAESAVVWVVDCCDAVPVELP